ncbi:dsRBD fold-containing protein, partial [Streptomyces tendae]
MYDKDLTNKWLVEIEFSEDEVHTHASVRAQVRDDTISTTGDAYRNPKDPGAPMIGGWVRGVAAWSPAVPDSRSGRCAVTPWPCPP